MTETKIYRIKPWAFISLLIALVWFPLNADAGGGVVVVKSFKRIPPGAHRFHHGKVDYFYHKGGFYRPGKGKFIKVSPPFGVVVASVPRSAATVVISGATYWVYDTVYYRKVPAGYQVVEINNYNYGKHDTAQSLESMAVGDLVRVRMDKINVRYGPGVDHEIKFGINYGTRLKKYDLEAGWAHVRLPDQTYGWVMKGYLAPVSTAAKG